MATTIEIPEDEPLALYPPCPSTSISTERWIAYSKKAALIKSLERKFRRLKREVKAERHELDMLMLQGAAMLSLGKDDGSKR